MGKWFVAQPNVNLQLCLVNEMLTQFVTTIYYFRFPIIALAASIDLTYISSFLDLSIVLSIYLCLSSIIAVAKL